MKDLIIDIFKKAGLSVGRFDAKRYRERKDFFRRDAVHRRFAGYTMIPKMVYLDNLALAEQFADVKGDIVECGVWKGGMSAGIAAVLGNSRRYWLFDSFEGLPPATEKDGQAAADWQSDVDGPEYHDNCAAPESFAREAMQLAGAKHFRLVRGWFSETLPETEVQDIAVLRLDGDWYDSTMTCLEALYPKVVKGGIVIIDDYYYWDGCTRAVHDYLSRHDLPDRIRRTANGVAYIVRNKSDNPLNP